MTHSNYFWHSIRIAMLTFSVSLCISLAFQSSFTMWISFLTLIVIIAVGIIFDIIGTAVAAAQEAPFHAMAAEKLNGAKEAIFLVRRADQVANVCNDVVGDICGTVSGALVTGIILKIAIGQTEGMQDLYSAFGIAAVAAGTVGGKALGKSLALNNANDIIFKVGKLLSLVMKKEIDPKVSKRKNSSSKVRKGKK